MEVVLKVKDEDGKMKTTQIIPIKPKEKKVIQREGYKVIIK